MYKQKLGEINFVISNDNFQSDVYSRRKNDVCYSEITNEMSEGMLILM